LYFYETKLLPTTLALWLLVFSLLLLQIAYQNKRISLYFLAGMVTGLLVVVRANMLIYGGLVFLGLLWAAWKTRNQPKSAAVLFAFGIAISMGPVMAHNLSHGELVPVAANGGINLYIGNHPEARGVYVDPPGFSGVITDQAAEADSLVKQDVGEVLRPAAENRYWVKKTLESIQAAPGKWLKLEALKFVLLVNREEETNNGSFFFESDQVPWLRWAPVKFNLLFALAFVGMVIVFRSRRRTQASMAMLWPSFSLLIAVLATALAFFVVSRYRLYAAPALVMFAGYALVQIWKYLRSSAWNKFVPAALTVVVLTGATWINPLGSGTNRHWEAGLLTRSAARLLEQGDRAGAKKAYLQALDLSEVRMEAHLGLARFAAEEGNIPEAIEYLEKARSLQPESFPVLNNLTLMYFQAARYEECIGVSRAASIVQPQAVDPKLYRALAMKELGDFQGSMDILGVLIQNQPQLRPAYIAAIEIALNTGHRDQAQRAYERALQYEVDLPAEVRAVFEP
ncbi:MAG: tetratricopeptide repeat protein, partial [Candidatus Eisenbacteria bacterium]|nr:tetratricopeptide repeat protein [Candidatus Eisenbacteria bacterium]